MADDWKERALAASAGTQTGAILACALGEQPTPTMCFHGKATRTSDGFLVCNYTDANGHLRLGAFVGSMEDLSRNIIRLSLHLKLDDDDTRALVKVISNWIIR